MKNSPRIWLEHELRTFAASLSNNSLVLDAGAGDQRYRPLFRHCRYESADFEQIDKSYTASTHVCDLASIPVDDDRYEAIVFTQVMEHLPEPVSVLRELLRVSQPGALLFCSVPMHYQEHEQPYDFFRYTQFGLRHVLESAGWDVGEVRQLDGYLSVAAHHLAYMKQHLPRHRRDYGPGLHGALAFAATCLCRPLLKRLARCLAHSAARHRYQAAGYPMNYLALARKPM